MGQPIGALTIVAAETTHYALHSMPLELETYWRQTILCFVCRKPPARLIGADPEVVMKIVTFEADLYCRDDHDLSIWWVASPKFRPSDVFVAVRKCAP